MPSFPVAFGTFSLSIAKALLQYFTNSKHVAITMLTERKKHQQSEARGICSYKAPHVHGQACTCQHMMAPESYQDTKVFFTEQCVSRLPSSRTPSPKCIKIMYHKRYGRIIVTWKLQQKYIKNHLTEVPKEAMVAQTIICIFCYQPFLYSRRKQESLHAAHTGHLQTTL